MPATPTTRLGLIGPLGTDALNIGDDQIRAFLAVLDATVTSFVTGTLAGRPAAGIVGRLYKPTDNNGLYWDTGSTWLTIVAPTVAALPGGTPVDGDRINYVADASAGVIWPFVYRAADASATKWNSIGLPAPLSAEVAAAEAGSNGAGYVALATAGPSITTPLAGDYWIEQSADFSVSATMYAYSYDVGGSGASDADAALSVSAGSSHISNLRRRRKTGLAASTAIVSKYKTAGGSGVFANRLLTVTPIRVG